MIKKEFPENVEIIGIYLEHYKNTTESYNMRKSSLNYFFGKSPTETCFGYNDHIFQIDTAILLDYFNWLKNIDIVTIQTRRNKWNVLISLLKYTMIYYNSKGYNFIVIIPTAQFTTWRKAIIKKTEKRTNANVYATKEEIERLLQYFKSNNFGHYIIFRTFTDTGMRKGELIEAKISDLNVDERYFHTKVGKTGEKIYVFKEDLAKFLKIYLNDRKQLNIDLDTLFLTKHLNQYGKRSFNMILNYTCEKIGIKKNITTKTFRKTLNDYRKRMGCSLETREQLIGHKNNRTNIENYTKFDLEELVKTYDRFYPFDDLRI